MYFHTAIPQLSFGLFSQTVRGDQSLKCVITLTIIINIFFALKISTFELALNSGISNVHPVQRDRQLTTQLQKNIGFEESGAAEAGPILTHRLSDHQSYFLLINPYK